MKNNRLQKLNVMIRKFLFFINPVSGTKDKLKLEKKIIQKCNEQQVGFEILFTAKDGDYTFLRDKVQEDSVTDIIVCGGDGSLNPIIASMLNSRVNFGIIPMGSGNGLAFAAKISSNIDKALEVVFNGKSSCVDAFYINGKVSCMLSGIGFDAKVAHDFSLQKKRGLLNYVRQSIKNFLSAIPYAFEVEVNDTTLKMNAFFISIANGNQFGNNFTIAPKASLNDGLLDIIIVKEMSKLRVLWAVLKQMKTGKLSLFSRENLSKKDVLYFQDTKVIVHNKDNAPLHIDGDPAQTSGYFDIEILPSAFRLIRPQGLK